MALVGGCTDDGVGSAARASGARIGLRAQIGIVASGAIRQCGIRTNAGHRIARSRAVALIGSCADDGISTHASSRLAGIRLRTTVVVIACRAIC